VLDPGTILKFDKIPSMLLAGMNIKRTTKQKWLIGCLSVAGVLVVLSGLAIGGFLMFMKWLRTVPPESTQIVLYNDTNERLRIDRILYGAEGVVRDKKPILEVYNQNEFTRYEASIFGIRLRCHRIYRCGIRVFRVENSGTPRGLSGGCQTGRADLQSI
jgi:hypothetical protein